MPNVDKYKKAYLAGGCFWCLSQPFDEYRVKNLGIMKVVVGYMGGKTINPTYKQVKEGKTGHLESVYIEYDDTLINYQHLLEIYFDNIDPFDDGGQYIDRGSNYQCAIFYLNEEEKHIAEEYVKALEMKTKKKVMVKIRPYMPFYEAEEPHQDYYIKNTDAYKNELLMSGRLKKKGEFMLGGKMYKVVRNSDGTYNIIEKKYKNINIKENKIMVCRKCGREMSDELRECPNCGTHVSEKQIKSLDPQAKSKLFAGLMGIILGGFGIHNFYLGYKGKAIAQLLLTIFIIGIPVSLIWSFIEGIMILVGKIDKDASGRALKE